VQGNLWCGFGSDGSADADAARLDGVKVYDATGKALAHIHLPERCANLCFGGAKGNRLFMASTHSLYALYVNTRGAVA
jgi:gluconolactonase